MRGLIGRLFGRDGAPAHLAPAAPTSRAEQSTDSYLTIRFRPLTGEEPMAGTVGWRCGPDTRVTLKIWEGPDAAASGIDLFEAFRAARLALEKTGFIPMVEGARRDSFPSGMARNMGEGEMTYRLTEGQSPALEDLRFLFDPAEADEVGPVAEQERAFSRWAAGLPEED